MTKHTETQINALKGAAKNKRLDTLERVRTALLDMEEKQLPITFRSVARMANVSRDWLYKENEIRSIIEQRRSKSV